MKLETILPFYLSKSMDKVFAETWLEQWNDDNRPKLHHPYLVEDYLFVLGDCTGVVVYPDSGSFTYELLGEDDGSYFLLNGNWEYKNIKWMEEDIVCMKVALDFIKQNASPEYYINSTIQCSWKLPWQKV